MESRTVDKMQVVCFGGGNALPKAVLPGLKNYDLCITTVTSMVDSGGSTGALRKMYNILPPGDIRRHLLALSDAPEWKKQLFAFRFGEENFGEGHKGHVLGNVFIAALEYYLKDYTKILEIVHDFLEVKGRCLPATIDKTHLYAVLENGQIIEGEDEIDVPKNHDPTLRIKKIFSKPEAKVYGPAVEAVREADVILIGPGDLYSSILPCFLPKGMKEAIQQAKGKKIFISPLMTKKGETHGFRLMDFVEEVENYIGCKLDYIIYNTKVPPKEKIEAFLAEEKYLQEMVLGDEGLDDRFIGRDLLVEDKILHHPEKLARTILEII